MRIWFHIATVDNMILSIHISCVFITSFLTASQHAGCNLRALNTNGMKPSLGASSSPKTAWWIVLANFFIFPVTESLSPMHRSQSSFSLANFGKINNKSLALERWSAESCLSRFRTCVPLSLIISHLIHKSLISRFQEYSRWGLKTGKFWWTA